MPPTSQFFHGIQFILQLLIATIFNSRTLARWAFAIRPEWGSNNLAQGREKRRPGYCVRQRDIALKGQNSLGSFVCVGTVCSAPSGQLAVRAVRYPERRFALPWAAMCKPVGLLSPNPLG